MAHFFQQLIKIILEFRQISGRLLTPALPYLDLLALIVSGFLLWLIIYTIARSGYMEKRIELFMDMYGVGNVGKYRQLKGWKKIVKKIKTDDLVQWKSAVLEADKILDDIIKESGYRAETVDARLNQLTPEILPNLEEIKKAHSVRNQIMQEADFTLTKDEAIAVLKIYKKAFQELGLLDLS